MDTKNWTGMLNGDARAACSELIGRCGDSVYRFCRSLTWSKEDAEDLFQDVFVAAFHQYEKLCASEEPTRRMLSMTARLWTSRKRKFARRRRIAPQTPLDDAIPGDEDPAEAYLSGERRQMVRRAIEALPDRFKIPIGLYYALDMSIPEIASTLGLPEGTVKSRLFKARKLIGKELEATYFER